MLKYIPTKGGGVEVMQVTYQKRDGCILQRIRNTVLPYKVGETTSMGWKVLNIEYEYKGKYYPEYKYNMLIHKDKQTSTKKKQNAEVYLKEIKTFLYYFMAVVIVNFLKILLGL